MKTKLILLLALLAVSAPAQLFNYPAPGPTTAQFLALSNSVAAIVPNTNIVRLDGTNTLTGTNRFNGPTIVAGSLVATNVSLGGTGNTGAGSWKDSQLTVGFVSHALADLSNSDWALYQTGFYGALAALNFSADAGVSWWSGGTYGSGTIDLGISRAASNVLAVTSGTTATYRDLRLRTLLAYAQPSDPSSSATFGQLYAKTNGATTEVYVMDGAGNVTQISPHARASSPAPASVDAGDKTPIVIHHKNLFTGEQEWLHLSAMARKLEQLTGEKFVWKSRLPANEVRDWDAEQARLEAESDAEVKADRARLKEWERSELTNKGPRPEVREKHRRAAKPDFLK